MSGDGEVENGMPDAPVVSPPPDDHDTGDVLDTVLGEVVDGGGDSAASRDERGRFAKREGDPQQPADGGQQPAAADASQDGEDQPQSDVPKYNAPDGWSEAVKAEFAALDDRGKALVMAQHEAFSQYGQEVQQYVDGAKPFMDAINDHADYFRRASAALQLHPAEIIANLARVEGTLRFGTYAEKVQEFTRLAKDYGLPVQVISDPLAEPTAPGGERYAEVHDLRQQLQAERSRREAAERAQESRISANMQAQMQSFATATAANGELKHPFFDAVKGTMGRLIEQGHARTLDDAYKMAAAPIEAQLASQLKRANEAERKRQDEAVRKAKRAAPVKVTGAPNGAADASLDEILASVIQ